MQAYKKGVSKMLESNEKNKTNGKQKRDKSKSDITDNEEDCSAFQCLKPTGC